MCLAQVQFAGDEEEQSTDVLSDIAHVGRMPGGLRVVDLPGNVTELDADIRSIDFMRSLVNVEKRMPSARAQ